ncbi:hypothetical protein [Pseudomonas sp. RGB]|uniref:hypothetical protein n=1 Tax=unclassified Pseudomonas TaxID=196821 RepID=UPI002114D0AA|nr:hypothetical protein [Pseudomonas sp. RGB]
MGPRTVAELVADCGWDYILNCLDRGISPTVFSGNALHALAQKCILQRRRQRTGRHDWELGNLSKDEARELWYDKAVEENHKFTHLRRVVEAVQAALPGSQLMIRKAAQQPAQGHQLSRPQ